MISNPVMTSLSMEEWRNRATVHRARAEHYTIPARRRRDCGMPHPIEDFLFQYYPYPISLLENWQPGCGVVLEWGEAAEFEPPPLFSERHYTVADGWIAVDTSRLGSKERERLKWITVLLAATRNRPPNFDCYGLHEWAMVYRGKEVRHEKTTPLRLPQAAIDAVVESRAICCSHHDAFRFFASEARPMNRLQPTLESRIEMEQPGCVHANMDLYKWAAKSMPWIGSELLLECFELAVGLRDLDMRASPYDLTAWGREPICIETPEGRRIYEMEQRRLASGAVVLRERLITALKMLEL
ncbi:MAG: 3-methyladenine DNA glycosylase [Gloeobacteraceae cyanobacterium ES-bin-144]|nr:3-methyladenine DNA glycosylase [Verrucomicrobiales bacterium]